MTRQLSAVVELAHGISALTGKSVQHILEAAAAQRPHVQREIAAELGLSIEDLTLPKNEQRVLSAISAAIRREGEHLIAALEKGDTQQ